MAFHVRDPETDRLVRELAKRKGTGITEAVREAARNELSRAEGELSLWERTADIRAEIAAWPKTGAKADKEYFDEMWDESDQ